MAQTKRKQYDLYLNTQATGIVKAAETVLIENHTQLIAMGFRYTDSYLSLPNNIALDPIALPLNNSEFEFSCAHGLPSILDDYLPDAWGRKVLAQIAFYQHHQKLNSHSAIDMLSYLGHSRIGALLWCEQGQTPNYQTGSPLVNINLAEKASQIIDAPQQRSNHMDEMSLLYLANAGTGAGGARPKALLYDETTAYLAKFNRLHNDSYNNARVELACLIMAQKAGINAYNGHIVTGINGRETLLLNRFDISDNQQHRRHLITVNALLKHTGSQADRGGVFRYDDIATLIRQYSHAVEADLKQLLRLMLFNRAINNTDDHERNFSFMSNGKTYQLSPAYDMVPSLTVGAYHVAGYQYSATPPKASEVLQLGKIFGLPKPVVREIAEHVIAAIEQWEYIAETVGVSSEDMLNVKRVFNC